MKFGINNPAWLQMAGNAQSRAKEYISLVSEISNPTLRGITAVSDVKVVSTFNGTRTTQTLTSPYDKDVQVQSDANTTIYLYGKITTLNCATRQLIALDVSNDTALTNLGCGVNKLTSLDVSNNTALTDLSCADNQLSSLDVSNNTALTDLSCNENQLSSLDVSNNTELTQLRCYSNPVTSIYAAAVNLSVAEAIASLITHTASTTGTVTLRNGDEHNSIISDAATTKGWTVEYVDA